MGIESRPHAALEEADGSREVADLVGAAAGGDRSAWNAIVRRFSPLVWSVTRAHGLSPSDAADVSQVVWLRLVENLGRINQPNGLGGWLATVTRRECLRLWRTSGREAPYDEDALADIRDSDPEADRSQVELQFLVGERDVALWRAVEMLPCQCAMLVRVLVSDPRPSYEEIASALDIKIGSIGPTRGRCLERLRSILLQCGINGADDLLLRGSEKGEVI